MKRREGLRETGIERIKEEEEEEKYFNESHQYRQGRWNQRRSRF